MQRNFTAIRGTLKETGEAGGFLLRYAKRDSGESPALGALGIRCGDIVENYRRTLRWVSREWRALGLIPPQKRFTAFVFELAEAGYHFPFTFWDPKDVSWACLLPSRTARPTKSAELRLLRTVAAHEGTHCWCHQQTGFHEEGLYLPERWDWISEGTAVWMELRLLERGSALRSDAALSHCENWCDYPEHPMLTLGRYQCGMFVRYLARRWNDGLIGRIWTEGSRDDEPWALIRRLTGQAELLRDYAIESYFYGDPASACYSSQIAQRFHSRAVAENVVLTAGAPGATIAGSIEDSATCYYSLRAPGRDHVNVEFHDPDAVCLASATPADAAVRRIGEPMSLKPETQQVPLPPGTDHLVVAVTVEPEQWLQPRPHPFQIVVA